MDYKNKLSGLREKMEIESVNNSERIIIIEEDEVEKEIGDRIQHSLNTEKYSDESVVNLSNEKTLLEVLTVKIMQRLGYPDKQKYRIIARKSAENECRVKELDKNKIIR